MDKLRLKMIGRQDRNKNDYYFTTTKLPVHVDLSKTVIHFFPEEYDDGGFGGELVIRHHDKPGTEDEVEDEAPRRRRRRSKSQDATAE